MCVDAWFYCVFNYVIVNNELICMDQTNWINILNGAVKLLTQHNHSHLMCGYCGLGFVY